MTPIKDKMTVFDLLHLSFAFCLCRVGVGQRLGLNALAKANPTALSCFARRLRTLSHVSASGRVVLVILAIALLSSRSFATLKPEQIALIVNAQVPESEQLAHFYAKARGVPESQIIPLNLPVTDEIIFDNFEQYVRPTIKNWLIEHHLQDQIKCLVTMYGVPLRIGERVNSPRENNEIRQLESLHRELLNQLANITASAESKATAADPTFTPAAGGPATDLVVRLQAALTRLQLIAQQGGPAAAGAGTALTDLVRQIKTPVVSDNPVLATTRPTTQATEEQAKVWANQPFDDDARAELRSFVQQKGSLIELTRVVAAQAEYLSPKATNAAFDSELALLWWPTYPHANWLINPLLAGYHGQLTPPVVMTMRLDAPTVQGVRDLIANSVLVERAGLTGKIVIDSRGLPAKKADGTTDPYGIFDERLKKLANALKDKTTLPIVFDEQPDVLQPGSVSDVAVYVGWYSVRKYVPLKFARGAVGYHVASFELVNLRNPRETGWVRGMLLDGVVGTSGPVAEPYLHSFPVPEYYIPLMLSGKVNLAEAYWASTPLTSWMQSCIGDPLYTPFAKNPAMKVEDLAPELQQVVKARQAQ